MHAGARTSQFPLIRAVSVAQTSNKEHSPCGMSRCSVDSSLSVCFASADSCVCASFMLAVSGVDASYSGTPEAFAAPPSPG